MLWVFVTSTVGEIRKMGCIVQCNRKPTLPGYPRTSQHESRRHPRPRFVAPQRTASHLHESDDLFGAVIGPEHILVPIKNSVSVPMFAQAQEQNAQLAEGRERLGLSDLFFGDLFPQLIQATTSFWGQCFEQAFDFLQDPQPIFGHGLPQFVQRAYDPAAYTFGWQTWCSTPSFSATMRKLTKSSVTIKLTPGHCISGSRKQRTACWLYSSI